MIFDTMHALAAAAALRAKCQVGSHVLLGPDDIVDLEQAQRRLERKRALQRAANHRFNKRHPQYRIRYSKKAYYT